MILKIAYQDTNGNDMDPYWDALRGKNYEASFKGVKSFIKKKESMMGRRRKRVPAWRWMLAALIPVLIVVACTKTERTEPIGYTVSFAVPEGNKQIFQKIQSLSGGTSVVADNIIAGYISYTFFINSGKAGKEFLTKELQAIKGINQLSIVPVNTQVKESLASRLSYKIFNKHFDATGVEDDVLKQSIESQLKNCNIIAEVEFFTRNGHRLIKLKPAAGSVNYSIDLSIKDGPRKMVLHEEKRMFDSPPVDMSSMTDAQVRDFIRTKLGAGLNDDDIIIQRTEEDLLITIKQNDKEEKSLRFKLK
jgi:hypothetical protein